MGGRQFSQIGGLLHQIARQADFFSGAMKNNLAVTHLRFFINFLNFVSIDNHILTCILNDSASATSMMAARTSALFHPAC